MNLLFDFTVDKETSTIHITREFAADLDLVWDAWTKSEILDRWTAPKPLRAETKEMNFTEGGRWIYAMISPENVYLGYSLAEYLTIAPKTHFITRNTFCDENGKQVGTAFSITTNTFEDGLHKTTVRVAKKFDNLADVERMVAMGFKEGMEAALHNLDEYLKSMVSSK